MSSTPSSKKRESSGGGDNELRTKIIGINNQIASFANRKELTEAMALFNDAVSKGWVNSHTLAAAINANVRCGNIAGAAAIYAQLRSSGHGTLKGTLKLDVISCTTMMKGYASIGDIAGALKIFDDMAAAKPKLIPNVRTFNTFLRGCVMTGSIDLADKMILQMTKEYKVPPDVSSWEYCVTLLCQGLKLDKALPIVGRLKSDKSMIAGMAAMYLCIARAAAMVGDIKNCKKALTSAEEALIAEEKHELESGVNGGDGNGNDGDNDDYDGGDAGGGGKRMKQQVTGGKVAWKRSQTEATDSRAQSLELYKEHRRAEIRQEIIVIQSFIKKLETNNKSNFAGDKDEKDPIKKRLSYLIQFLHRAFSFPAPGEEVPQKEASTVDKKDGKDGKDGKDDESSNEAMDVDDKSTQTVADKLVSAVRVKFGLDECLKLLVDSQPTEEPSMPQDKEKKGGGDEKQNQKEKEKEKEKKKKKKNKAVNESSKSSKSSAAPVLSKSASELLTSVEESVKSCIDESGYVNFANVFGMPATQSSKSSDKSHSLPSKRAVKMEICSGAGEWAVAQALADPNSDWVTMELRHDRVYQTFTRAVFQGASNLCVMGGDAMSILPQHISDSSLRNVFVNHPEPPQQTGGLDSQGHHLLTPEFFFQIFRVLEMEGIFTIVTDNLWYGRFLMRMVGSILASKSAPFLTCVDMSSATAASRATTQGKKEKEKEKKKEKEIKNDQTQGGCASKGETNFKTEWQIQEEENGVRLYVGKPGYECGHVTDASSYFDRLWKRGKLTERYFLVLQKKATYDATAAARAIALIHRKNAASSVEGGASDSNASSKKKKNLPVSIVHLSQPANKKIKFDD